jgi:hypothetical protein
VDGIRVDERDLEAEHALSRRLVDQLGARVGEVHESSADVVHLVGDVVHPGAALREEAAHGGVLAERAEQLEPALPDPDRHGLHTLLVDPRAVLEPRAEEALVGLEGAIEIVDGEPDVMNRARRVHPAIVFERLALTMRVPALALVLTAVLLAGCGGSSNKESASNGEASKSANQVLADAKAAATQADSAHVKGSIVSGGTPIKLDLSMARAKGAKGTMSTNGLSFDLVRVGDTLYIKGSDDFYKHFAGAAVAQLLHGKWLKASATQGQLKSLAPLTNIRALLAGISANHGKLANKGTTTYNGQKVVEIRDTSDNSRLYVAATGKPYPVAIVGGKKNESGTITFGDWSSGVSLSAPEDALDISQLGG